MRPSEQLIVAQVREGDHDRYLCAQFAPPAGRPALLAILAFALELELVHGRTSREPMMGALRFAWWRQAVDAIYAGGHIPPHPVLESLTAAIRTYALPRQPLDQLIDATEVAAQGGAKDLEGYVACCRTEGAAPLLLWLHVLGLAEHKASMTAAVAAGSAWSLARHAHRRDNRAAILALVDEEIARGRAVRAEVGKGALPALLPTTLAARSLRLLRHGRDPHDDSRVARQLSLLGRALLGRY